MLIVCSSNRQIMKLSVFLQKTAVFVKEVPCVYFTWKTLHWVFARVSLSVVVLTARCVTLVGDTFGITATSLADTLF